MQDMQKTKVLSTMRFTGELLDQLRGVSPRLHVLQQTCHNRHEVATALANHPDVEVLYTFQPPTDILDLAPRLRWLQLHSAGSDHLLDQPIMSSEVTITPVDTASPI